MEYDPFPYVPGESPEISHNFPPQVITPGLIMGILVSMTTWPTRPGKTSIKNNIFHK